MRKVILMLRQSKNFFLGNIDYSNFLNIYPKEESRFLSNMRLWNENFGMSYMDFKKRIFDISKIGYGQNDFDLIYLWQDFDALKEYTEDVAIVPLDTDDWISKDLAGTVRNYDMKRKSILIWGTYNVEANGYVSTYAKEGLYCRSCSFASFYPFEYDYMTDNVMMTSYKDRVLRTGRVLAVKLTNISSYTWLGNSSFEDLVRLAKKKVLLDRKKFVPEYHFYVTLYNNLLIEFYESYKSGV